MTHAGRVDACPGILEPHPAADGDLVRIRVPGGFLSAAALEVLGSLATACAGDWLELTSRGNVGLRAVTDLEALRAGLDSAGLLARDAAHDRVRNIIASPLTGLGAGPDARPLVAALDAALSESASVTPLSGRFLFGVDDGSGLSENPDLGLRWAAGHWQLTIDGWLTGPATVEDLLATAARFLESRGEDVGVWRVRELPGGAAALGRPLASRVPSTNERLPLGEYAGNSRAVIVAGWLRRVSAAQLRALAAALIPGEQVRVTAAGRIVVPVETSAAAGVLAASGLLVAADDPRGNVTTCSGLGACERATVDVRALAADRVGSEAIHLVSCPRACGTPTDARVEVLTA